MLEQILDFIHNYFVKERHSGEFTIADGALDVDFLQENQYFKIVGSVFNDGVYQYNTSMSLTDETFEGEIWAMAIPVAVIALTSEVEDWVEKYGDSQESPYSSESFGGYSYTKASGSADGIGGGSTWQSIYGSRLNQWRKIS